MQKFESVRKSVAREEKMLGRLKEIVGFGKSGNRRETDLEFRIVNGVVEEKSCEPQAPYAGLQVLGEVQQSTFCETGVSRSSAFPSESLGTSKIHQGGLFRSRRKKCSWAVTFDRKILDLSSGDGARPPNDQNLSICLCVLEKSQSRPSVFSENF